MCNLHGRSDVTLGTGRRGARVLASLSPRLCCSTAQPEGGLPVHLLRLRPSATCVGRRATSLRPRASLWPACWCCRELRFLDSINSVWSLAVPLQIERQVEQKRASWYNLNEDQQETVDELTDALKTASEADATAAELLSLLRL